MCTCSLHFCWSCFFVGSKFAYSVLHLIALVQHIDYPVPSWFLQTSLKMFFFFFFPPEDWISCCFHRGFKVKCSNISIAISGLGVKFFSAISSLTFLEIEITLSCLLCLQKTSAFSPSAVAYYKYFLWCVFTPFPPTLSFSRMVYCSLSFSSPPPLLICSPKRGGGSL